MVGVLCGVIIMMISFVLRFCSQLLLHFDVMNSILVSGVIQLLTLNKDWSTGMRWAIFLGIVALCWVLQNISLIMKILFGAFSTVSFGLLGWIWIPYESVQKQWAACLICVALGMFLNILCWMSKAEHNP